MKNFYLLFLLLLPSFVIHAQGDVEIFGLKTWAVPQPEFTNKGWGGGMNFFCKPVVLRKAGQPYPLNFQFGQGFYLSGMGYRKFSDVPVLAPQTGMGKVKLDNTHSGFSFFARFSSPDKTGSRIPYVDFFSGLRFTSSAMHITDPDKKESDTTLLRMTGFNCGIGAGMKIKLGDGIYLDGELLWTYSPLRKDIVSLPSASKDSKGIFYNTEYAPNNIMLLKIGFDFVIESTGDYNTGYSPGAHHSGGGHGGGGHGGVHASSGGHAGGGHGGK